MVSPYETYCTVKFADWPASGTTVTNEGSAGAGYNGTLASNEYVLQPTGATSDTFANAGDHIIIPKGSAVDNLGAHTMEFIVYNNSSASFTLFNKASTYKQYQIWIDTTNNWVEIRRYGTDGSSYYQYTTPVNSIKGAAYTIQVAWDATLVSNVPVIVINNVNQTVTTSLSGTVSSWISDSSYNVTLGNNPGGTSALTGAFYLYRLHSAKLTTPQLQQNFAADWWRRGSAYTGTAADIVGTWNAEIATSAIIHPSGQAGAALTVQNAGCGATSAIIHPSGQAGAALTVQNAGCGLGAVTVYGGTSMAATGTWAGEIGSGAIVKQAGSATAAATSWWPTCGTSQIGRIFSNPSGATAAWWVNCGTTTVGHIFECSTTATTMWQSSCMPPVAFHRVWKLFMQPITVVVEKDQNLKVGG